MADSDSDIDISFHGFPANLERNVDLRGDIGDSGHSDISVSSVHTSDLSDWDEALAVSTSSSDGDDSVDSDLEWTDEVSDWDKDPFTEIVGPQHVLPINAKPLDYFLQLFPEEMFVRLCEEIIGYAHQNGDASFTTSVAEMKAYMGVLL
jgi:hypothetical protein